MKMIYSRIALNSVIRKKAIQGRNAFLAFCGKGLRWNILKHSLFRTVLTKVQCSIY